MIPNQLTAAALAVLAASCLATSARAQSREDIPLTQKEIEALVADAMPPIVGEDNSSLVKAIGEAKLGTPLSKTFDPKRISSAVFGRTAFTRAADCDRTTTAANEPDDGNCTLMRGSLDGTGALVMFSYSKTIQNGNIKILKRAASPAEADLDKFPLPPSTKLSDTDALNKALAFAVETLGLPKAELPVPPTNSTVGFKLPVRTLAIGGSNGDTKTAPIAVQKIVTLQRALQIPTLRDPSGGSRSLSQVLAPGRATLVLDDGGVQQVSVSDWHELVPNPKLRDAKIKSRSQLVEEIAQDLLHEGITQISSVKILIGLDNGLPDPDNPDSPQCTRCFLMNPALIVSVTPVAKKELAVTPRATAGFLRSYNLADLRQTSELAGR